MRIDAFRIVNYKSFRDSDKHRLTPGFNVIVGQNNAGKTALVEMLRPTFEDKPHRSLKTVPTPTAQPNPTSWSEVSFELNSHEFWEILGSSGSNFYIPVDPAQSAHKSPEGAIRALLKAVSGRIVIESAFNVGGVLFAKLKDFFVRPDLAEGHSHGIQVRVDPLTKKLSPAGMASTDVGPAGTVLAQVVQTLRSRVYYFKAERMNVGQSNMGYDSILAPDASNLPRCLHTLQSNKVRFERFNKLVSEIFPEVKYVSATIIPGTSSVRIDVWTVDPRIEREDLAVQLSESGTGIGQVLAILYVVLTSEVPKTIIIDEPQSFLHPGAVRKLIDILKHYQRLQHQYVITTHSPAAITAADPQVLLLLTKEGAESVITPINPSETHDQELLLHEVGARLSDVFGADNILWVEGTTEEKCFPLIMSQVANRPLLGTKVLAVSQTGDFEGKDAERVFEIYSNLSRGGGLLPPAVGFVFDREKRDEKGREDLRRQSGDKVVFTPRMMYENYLLNPGAIAAVLSATDEHRPEGQVTLEEVEDWLEDNKWNKKYFAGGEEGLPETEDERVRDVHAANLLEDLFGELSEHRVEYRKVTHGVELTQWLLENEPKELDELARLIEEMLPPLETYVSSASLQYPLANSTR